MKLLLDKKGICLAVKEKLTKDSGVAEEAAFDHIVEKLQAHPKARGNRQQQYDERLCMGDRVHFVVL